MTLKVNPLTRFWLSCGVFLSSARKIYFYFFSVYSAQYSVSTKNNYISEDIWTNQYKTKALINTELLIESKQRFTTTQRRLLHCASNGCKNGSSRSKRTRHRLLNLLILHHNTSNIKSAFHQNGLCQQFIISCILSVFACA